IDAVSKEKYQQIHKADCFDKILRNLNDIVNYKKNNKITIPKIIPNFVLCNINENESIQFIKKFGIRLELIKKLQQYNNTIVENELYSGNYLPFDYAVIRGVNDFSGQMENKKVADYTPPQRNYCRQFSTGLFIKADGNITICRNDFKGNYSLGSIKNQSIKDILLSKKYEGYCEKHEKLDFSGIDLCKNCRNWYEVY
ncbi:MAG TPA: SPASM domain-containing protein, partial [bacterium]|nr:SPASM domain-containing protein [bacterium]